MAKHLNKKEVDAVVRLILGWKKGKLTWEAICAGCEGLIGRTPTRQALSGNAEISAAYKKKKSASKVGEGDRRPASLSVASGRIASLEKENERLKEENRLLRQQFVTWQYNAYRRGLTEHILNEPLPLIDRHRSDGERR